MGERISRGFRLLGASWRVVQSDRELLLLPIMAIGSVTVLAIVFGALGWSRGVFELQPEGNRSAAMWILLGLFYFLAYAIGIFFNAALVGAATIRLQGGDPRIADGLRLAWERIDKILGWAVIAASVGLAIQAMRERGGLFGRIAGAIAEIAWSAVTFFVIPVMLYEPLGVGASIKRSAQIFRQRWGETFVGNGAIGLAMFIVALPVIVFVCVPLLMASPFVGIVVTVLVFAVLWAFGATMTGIFNAALYRYAVAGEITGPFTEGDLHGAFRHGGRRGRAARSLQVGFGPRPSLEEFARSEIEAARNPRPSSADGPKATPPGPPTNEQPPLF